MKVFAVIMAGGIGARFWPMSRQKTPKQLLNIFGENTLIQDTVSRLDGIVEPENIYIVSNKIQAEGIQKQLPQISPENIITEPFGKNTAACIALASTIIRNKFEDSVILTLPADHFIKDINKFRETMLTAIDFASKNDALVTLGIKPSRPETGYGYIQIDDKITENVFRVKTFAEKPNYETALRFVDSGDFFWNSGMFIWRSSVIMSEIEIHLPDLYDGMKEIEQTLNTSNYENVLSKIYGQLRSISIDYGVMEKTKNAYLIKGEFDWSDVGSWDAVYELLEKDDDGNSVSGDVYLQNTVNSFVKSDKKFTAVIGLDNLVVVETKDALLICDRYKTQDVKSIIDFLKMKNRNELL